VSAAADDIAPLPLSWAAAISDAVTLPTAPSVTQRKGADGSHLLYPPKHAPRRRRRLSGENIAILSGMSGPLPVNLPAVKIIKAKVTLELAMTAESGP
jgi:hypothetical protein